MAETAPNDFAAFQAVLSARIGTMPKRLRQCASYVIEHPEVGTKYEYIDGEVRETLSVHVARDQGVDLVIVFGTGECSKFGFERR